MNVFTKEIHTFYKINCTILKHFIEYQITIYLVDENLFLINKKKKKTIFFMSIFVTHLYKFIGLK